MNVLSPYGPRPLSALLSFIGHHTVSPPKVSFADSAGIEPAARLVSPWLKDLEY